MAHLAKCVGLLSFLALVVSAQQTELLDQPQPKITVAPAKSIVVDYEAKVATPIKYTSQNYDGPYDPADPNGIIAARHRHMKLVGKKNAEIIKSYIPPGIDKFAKKELSKMVVGEGQRFAFAHPKETADLIGIALKAKRLVTAASDKVKKMEAEGHH